MFGLFKKKKYDIQCPMCGFEYLIKLNPSDFGDFNYEYKSFAAVVGYKACEYCKVKITITINKSGSVAAYDDKWEKVSAESQRKIDAITDDIDDIEELLEEDEENEKLKKKLEKLNERLDKAEDSYSNKESNYIDRQDRWVEKLENNKS